MIQIYVSNELNRDVPLSQEQKVIGSTMLRGGCLMARESSNASRIFLWVAWPV